MIEMTTNIETRLRSLEQAKSRQAGVLMFVVMEAGQTPEQTKAIRAAQAVGRPVLVLCGSDIDG